MFVTMVEAEVAPDRVPDLRDAWARAIAGDIPDGLFESKLLNAPDGRWRIVTVWESQEAVLAMRASGVPPAAVAMFEAAGATPTVSAWVVEGHLEIR